MSVIVFDGKTLACDRQMTNSDMRSEIKKLFQLSDNCFAAICGDIGPGLLMVEWYRNGADRAKFPENQKTNDWARLVVVRDGVPSMYEQYPVEIPLLGAYMAFGSGRDFAMGALHHGATAVEAVEAAIAHSTGCGFGVDFYDIK